MAEVKVPPMLHKMSMAFQKAWYKKHGMEMPASAAPMSAAKVKAKQKPVAKPEPVKKPLSKDERMSVIKKAAEKNVRRGKESRLRAAFGGEQMGAQYDNPISIARAGGIIKGYRLGEATKPDASMAMTDTLKNKMISDKDKRTLGKVAVLMARERTLTAQRNKDKKNAYVRGLGLNAMRAGNVDPARGHSPTRFGREVLAKEEVDYNQGNLEGQTMSEVTKKEAEEILGGPVKNKPKGPAGKLPLGYRLARSAARKAMNNMQASMKKEEVEQTEEGYGGTLPAKMNKEMQKMQKLPSMKTFRGKDSKGVYTSKTVNGKEVARKYETKEEVEQVDEAGKGYGPGWMLKHPDGKTLDAKLKAKKELERKRQKSYGDPKAGVSVKSEEVEQIDELKKSTLASYVKGATRDVASASRLQRGYETDAARNEFAPVRRGSELAAKNMRKFAGKRSRGIAKAVDKLAKEEVEQIEEGKADKSLAAKAQKSGISLGTLKSVFRRGVAAWNSGHRPGTTPSQWGHARVNSYINKGKTYHTADKDLREEKAKGKDPETSTEVELAKKHGDPKKITYGDVIKARIEASKKKALNKGE